MSESDIFLREDRVSVVGGDGSEVEGGREQGDLEVTVGEGEDPSVTLNADRANVTLGGGAGKAPEGDVKLLEQGGTTRVKITAEAAGETVVSEDHTVSVDGGSGTISLAPEATPNGTLEPTAELGGARGTLSLAERGATKPNVTVEASSGTASLGGVTSAGGVDVNDAEDDRHTRVRHDSVVVNDSDDLGGPTRVVSGRSSEVLVEPFGRGIDLFAATTPFATPVDGSDTSPSGTAVFYDEYENKGVEIQGGAASLKLGYAYTSEGNVLKGEQPVSRGKPGRIVLDDGNTAELVDVSTQFTVTADEGTLKVMAGNEVVFQVDPTKGGGDAGQIRIPTGWSVENNL